MRVHILMFFCFFFVYSVKAGYIVIAPPPRPCSLEPIFDAFREIFDRHAQRRQQDEAYVRELAHQKALQEIAYQQRLEEIIRIQEMQERTYRQKQLEAEEYRESEVYKLELLHKQKLEMQSEKYVFWLRNCIIVFVFLASCVFVFLGIKKI